MVAELARHVEAHGVGIDGLVLHRPDGQALSRPYFGDVWRQLRERA